MHPFKAESLGLDGIDGKRPDGVMIISWKNGKPISMGCNLPDTFTQSYHCYATNSAGAAAALAKERKSARYISLGPGYSFTHVVEILEAFEKRSLAILKELGQRFGQCTSQVKVYVIAYVCVCVHECMHVMSYMLLLTYYYY